MVGNVVGTIGMKQNAKKIPKEMNLCVMIIVQPYNTQTSLWDQYILETNNLQAKDQPEQL